MRIAGVAVIGAVDRRIYHMLPPNRHHNVIQEMAKKNIEAGTQGFITSTGLFVNRTQAMEIAVKSGQFKRREGAQYYQGPELYSEDLW